MRYFNWNLTRHWKWLKSIMSKKEDWQQKWTKMDREELIYTKSNHVVTMGKAARKSISSHFLFPGNEKQKRKEKVNWNKVELHAGESRAEHSCRAMHHGHTAPVLLAPRADYSITWNLTLCLSSRSMMVVSANAEAGVYTPPLQESQVWPVKSNAPHTHTHTYIKVFIFATIKPHDNNKYSELKTWANTDISKESTDSELNVPLIYLSPLNDLNGIVYWGISSLAKSHWSHLSASVYPSILDLQERE